MHKRKLDTFKKLIGVLMSAVLLMGITGCQKIPSASELAHTKHPDAQKLDKTMAAIISALEAKDEKALKNMFSPYAQKEADDLDEQIKELIEFYSGSSENYDNNGYNTHETMDYGKMKKDLTVVYTLTRNNENYKLNLVLETSNDKQPDRVGLYLIEVRTMERMDEDFKWKEEDDRPGIYLYE